MAGPLEGIRVLDFSWAQAGPYATLLLSDFGADVIKVERRGIGDHGRNIPPGAHNPTEGPCPYFIAHNRGKRSVTVDLATADGKQVIRTLATGCDVVVNNFRLGVMESLGLGYDDLKHINPRIIYGQVSAFGTRGPMAARPGFDILGQALGGIMHVTGMHGDPALPVGAAIADQSAALYLALGIMAALVARERQGVGNRIDVSLYGSVIGLQTWEIDLQSLTGKRAGKAGGGHPFLPALWGTYATADGWIVMGGVFDARWRTFCEVLGMPEFIDDERFCDGITRYQNSAALIDLVAPRLHTRTTAEWMDVFVRMDIIAAPVQTYDDILNDLQAQENGYVVTVDDPNRGPIKIVGCPIQLSETPAKLKTIAPELGQHTEEVLSQSGYSWEQIHDLSSKEIV
jgi:crotonobetainyl-CoA:carnitine CoA-transferase CaiB-like acyl-CoA transferase